MTEPVQSSPAPTLDSNPGVWLEQQCEILGVSVSRVAREARISRSTIYRWQRGQTEPYWGSVQRIRNVIRDYWNKRGG
jgi:predicted transcriptional regulator